MNRLPLSQLVKALRKIRSRANRGGDRAARFKQALKQRTGVGGPPAGSFEEAYPDPVREDYVYGPAEDVIRGKGRDNSDDLGRHMENQIGMQMLVEYLRRKHMGV